jgi:outer membrane protein assembly factor BamB
LACGDVRLVLRQAKERDFQGDKMKKTHLFVIISLFSITSAFGTIYTVDESIKGGEVFSGGSIHEIKWSGDCNCPFVNIELSSNSGENFRVEESNVPNNGSYLWQVPEIVDSNKCVIRIVPAVPDSNVVCMQSGVFTVRPFNPDSAVESQWQTLGKNFKRDSLSDRIGPEIGCIKWVFDTNGLVTSSVAVGNDGRVYAAGEDGNLYAIDANGSLLWKYDANTPLISSPGIGPDGTVYAGGENGNLYAIDRNGIVRWTYSTAASIYSSPAISKNNKIFAGSQDGKLYAIGPDGSELWTFETAGLGSKVKGSIVGSPAIDANGIVYITGLYDPNLYALDPNSGSILWKTIAKDFHPYDGNLQGSSISPVIGIDGTIYTLFREDPYLYAIKPNEGKIKWKTNLADPCSPWFGTEFSNKVYYYKKMSRLGKWYKTECFSEPVIGPDGTIYVSFDDPYLRAVDPNGNIKWTTRLGMVGGFTMAVGSNGLIYAACDDGYLCVVDSSGTELSRFIRDDILTYPVIAADNTLIVSDVNNKIWAIGANDCPQERLELHRPSDLYGDGIVNFYDIAILALNWVQCSDKYFGSDIDGRKTGHCNYLGDGIYFEGDVDRDLKVDAADFSDVVIHWLGREKKGKHPTVTITKPDNEVFFANTDIIEMRADAFDIDGQVVRIMFFANGEFIGSDDDGSDGWGINWICPFQLNSPYLTCYLQARAVDNEGMEGNSNVVRIYIFPTPPGD